MHDPVRIAQNIADLAIQAGEEFHPDDDEEAQAHAVGLLACCVEALARLASERKQQMGTAVYATRPFDSDTRPQVDSPLAVALKDAEHLLAQLGITTRDL